MDIKYVHTNIISQDWRKLAEFYIQVLGCQLLSPERKLSGAWLEKGTGVKGAAFEGVHLRLPGYGESGPTLEIYQYKKMEDKTEPKANRLGYGHLAFLVKDVAAMLNKLISKGGKSLGQTTQHQVEGVGLLTFVYATDPEGNILELQHWS
ncbi:catechol 2,3-dioxygenase-like lactoylglutathione lyase family enzyme [Catalinimonas alkaloidigena]|uniref:VOC family protein n=1 Tax=Catalinimonas alkaloidigena TaxID=1075417 RepID=UPI00240645D3|nr:VOC family protein [Catalinimonas alkaloidigena]MDF9798204.1 catechol 2,3-dioxygenase-like lactoylglutathione lyase family enzyme [Catalinimonas alkaloidigena]